MNRKLVIFGTGDIGALAHYYFSTDSLFDVAAFCVDAGYVGSGEFRGLPVVPFENVERDYTCGEHDFFVALVHFTQEDDGDCHNYYQTKMISIMREREREKDKGIQASDSDETLAGER